MGDEHGGRLFGKTSITGVRNPEDHNLIVTMIKILNLMKMLSVSGMQFLSKCDLIYISMDGVCFLNPSPSGCGSF
jgi:hypothetical protein